MTTSINVIARLGDAVDCIMIIWMEDYTSSNIRIVIVFTVTKGSH